MLNHGVKSNIITKNFWDITEVYSTYGFYYSFFNSTINTGVKKPNGYSKSTIYDIKNKLALLATENSTALSVNSSVKNLDIDDVSVARSETENST